MIPPLDVLVATTLADAARTFLARDSGAGNGVEFERALYDALLNAHEWRYATPPDQYDLGLPISTRTGTRYEHDGMVAGDDTLYIIEAKYLRSPVTREIVGIFVQKLLDTLLGSYEDIGHFAVKPVIVSGNSSADSAAWRHAAAFGILLIVPDRPTPHEVVGILQGANEQTVSARRLADETAVLATRLWRPFSNILRAPRDTSLTFALEADQIFNADLTAQLLGQWDECIQMATDLRLVALARTLRA
ncbi:MAG TPA: hypothetical protein VGS80_08735 [Ktedonobacterales bacterium]|nr:hypothetical protein [Ktedonobacterales bacterium]